jgi:hypothetical protein
MNLAGHGDFNTTRRFYLAVTSDLQDRVQRTLNPGVQNQLGYSDETDDSIIYPIGLEGNATDVQSVDGSSPVFPCSGI